MKKPQPSFHHGVFINCPFDEEYLPLFHAIVFTIHMLGFRARCSEEVADGEDRLTQIIRLIGGCKYGVHDLSRIHPNHKLPRFDMPLELGIDMGFKSSGDARYRQKNHLILDSHRRRHRELIPDLSGREIKAHNNKPRKVIDIVRNWLNDGIKDTKRHPLPGGDLINLEYQIFRHHLPAVCTEAGLSVQEITFNDYSFVVAKFITERAFEFRAM